MQRIKEIDLEIAADSGDNVAKQVAARHSILVSAVVNLELTITQVTAGMLTGSQVLIAGVIRSLSDLISSFAMLFTSHHSQKGPDQTHHYGHQRFENAASLVLGLFPPTVGVGMLWNVVFKLEHTEAIQSVWFIGLQIALGALAAKELLSHYMLAVVERVCLSMLSANAWYARPDTASSLVVVLGIVGSVLGYRLLDPVAAFVVGSMVTCMDWQFGWEALHDLMDHAIDEETVETIHQIMLVTTGVLGVHDIKTCRMSDMILVDAHLEVDARTSVREGHNIALGARRHVMERHGVLNLMTHMDPVDVPP